MPGQQGSYQPNASAWQTVYAPGTIGELAALAAVRTFVVKIRPSGILQIGSLVRAILAGPASGDCSLTNLYIGPASAAANAWQFSAATQITFDAGTAGKLLDQGAEFESDGVSFAFDASKALILAGELPVGARPRYGINLGDNVISYFKDGVSEASSLTKGSGYTALPGFSYLLARLEGANS